MNSENSTNISDSPLEGLIQTILKLKAEKKTRDLKLQEIVEKLHKLWNLMESTEQERRQFAKVVAVLGCTEEEITSPGILSLETFQEVDEKHTSLKDQLAAVTPLLEELRTNKEERIKQISNMQYQIEMIKAQISDHSYLNNDGSKNSKWI